MSSATSGASHADRWYGPPRSHRTSLLRRLARLTALYPASITLVALVCACSASTHGAIGLARVFLPLLLLAGFALVPLAAWTRDRWLILALAAHALIAVLFLAPDWLSPPSSSATRTLRVASWNLGNRGKDPTASFIDALLASDADLVGLQELRPPQAEALDRDARVTARWPYRALRPHPTGIGTGFLSAVPLDSVRIEDQLAADEAVLQFDPTVRVVNAHVFPGRVGLPYVYDVALRDAALARLHARIGDDPRVIVLGDYNLTPDEPAYASFTRGLQDAHAQVGFGPGWTWRPRQLVAFGTGLLRIDHVWSGPGLRPVATRVVCQEVGDHCMLVADLDVR